jgi:hypothetical protein
MHPRILAPATGGPASRVRSTPAATSRAARPRASTPVFVDGGRRARWLRMLGRLVGLGLVAWIGLTAVALVGPHWGDDVELRTDRAVAHEPVGEPDARATADEVAEEVPLFTVPAPDDPATGPTRRDAGPFGPVAASTGPATTSEPSVPATSAPDPAAPDGATATRTGADDQEAGEGSGHGPVARGR